jgi:hypothetical protein
VSLGGVLTEVPSAHIMPWEAEPMVHVSFLYYEECPSHEVALERLRQVLAEEGIAAEVEIVKIETDAEAEVWRFVGSPTILVEGRDVDPPPPGARPALACRAYRREDGRISPLPPSELIRRSLRSAQAVDPHGSP